MNVFGHALDPKEKWTEPFSKSPRFGVKLRLLGGDVMDPSGWVLRSHKLDGEFVPQDAKPDWFNAVPRYVYRAFAKTARLPFLSVGLGRFGFYIGWKVYGVDKTEYLDYPTVTRGDLYTGSRALVLTMRTTAHREVT